MTIEFESESLWELYSNGTTQDKTYNKLPKDIITRYVKVVNYLKLATRIESLFRIKSLHYEKKKWNLSNIETVWINDQYRLLLKSRAGEAGIINIILIKEISKHYE